MEKSKEELYKKVIIKALAEIRTRRDIADDLLHGHYSPVEDAIYNAKVEAFNHDIRSIEERLMIEGLEYILEEGGK